MTVLAAYIRHLIEMPYDSSKPRRKAFFLDPNAEMNAFRFNGRPLSNEEKAVLASLDYLHIIEYAKDETLANEIRDFVDYNDDDDDWPDPGDPTWNPWNNGRQCSAPLAPLALQEIFWSRPRANITWVSQQTAPHGAAFALRIAGEGLLEDAFVEFKLYAEPHTKFKFQSNDYIPCNIRRSYISADVVIPTAGRYGIKVWNKGWKKYPLDWNTPFEVT